MRHLVFIGFSLIALLGNGQLAVRPILKDSRSSAETSTSVKKNTLPFWDDFSITEDGLPDCLRIWGTDTTRQWGDSTRGVFVNSTLAINPPTYKVVTFDGLDENGQIYSDGRGLTDQLYSDTLDLSNFSATDDLYISFFWQAGGNVERPDEKDSIRLQFYNLSADTIDGNPWQNVWSQAGSEDLRKDIFIQEAFPLEDRFISDTSMFRFQAFGDQDGPFDAWHLDWIYLDSARVNDDFFYFDRALTGQLTSPFSPFKSLPTHQLRAGPSNTGEQLLQTSNLFFNTFSLAIENELINSIDGTIYSFVEREFPNFQEDDLDPFEFDSTFHITFDSIDLSTIPIVDSLNLESMVYIADADDGFIKDTNINLRINDTIRVEYLLHDYYAYDDGTAEYAVGTNQQGDQIGVQYWVNEQDTLTHVDIHFPNIAPDSDGETLILRIFRDLEDERAILSQSITVSTANTKNEFTSYELSRPLILSDTFFITYEQNVSQYISLGLDRSNEEASPYIFQNITGQWERNNRIKGALMIRPVFKNVEGEFVLGTETLGSEETLTIYPNPTHGVLNVSGSYSKIELRNISGQLLKSEMSSYQHDFSELPRGLYLLSIFQEQKVTTQKIILE